MSTRKKSTAPRQPPKSKPGMPPVQPAAPAIDVDAMLMVGEERVHIDCEQDDNVTFMAEQID
ncbi:MULTISPECIES: hypothetical protein [unclassified Duganella]|jgi:hypothetical protein|uniref:hypothetical protein n=1 Tax=unclassified Duganella TaxID=2636909 RepID=UPI00088389B6|nr:MULTISPECIES: hypothetical protein [unclassified Duganella]SDF38829.1 hypothetical protein SAMN05216320_10130 [Duganella sp. OV458]SDI87680.1 hypothetical protein SAMN05428973_1011394 [Duganella sp. OV510]